MESAENRYQKFTSLLLEITRLVQRIKDAEMAQYGLRGKQVQCLFVLLQASDGLSLSKLAELCAEDKSSVSRTVRELAAQNLVYVDEKRQQRYKNPIRLTNKGHAIANEVAEKIGFFVELSSDGISSDDREVLYRTLEIIADNLGHSLVGGEPVA